MDNNTTVTMSGERYSQLLGAEINIALIKQIIEHSDYDSEAVRMIKMLMKGGEDFAE